MMVNHHGGVIRIGDHLYGYSNRMGWTCQDVASVDAVWQEKDELGKGSFYMRTGCSTCVPKAMRIRSP